MNSVIVVGAGFAGLSAALHLARRGARVTVLEANAHAGGRAGRITGTDGFEFDAGPTLIVMVDALRAALGERAFQALELRRLEPGYRIFWPNGDRFDLSSNIAVFLDEIARYEGLNRRSAAVRYLADVHEQYVHARAKILDVDHTPLSFLRTLMAPGKFAPWSLGKLRSFASQRFRHERTIQALTFQPLYLGTSPLRAPAMYALLAVEEIVGGIWYARGGTSTIVDALVRECERAGVTFSFNTPVRRILTRGGKARAVETADRASEADGVIVTADREPAMHALFDLPAERTRKLRYGHSAMLWYLGVSGKVELPHHSVFLPEDPWQSYADLDAGTLPREPMIYVCNPGATDAAAAPPGTSALTLLAPVPNAAALPSFDRTALRERVLSRLERQTGPLRGRILFEATRAPSDFASQLGLAHGAAFGPDHTLDQMGPLRPPIRHPQLSNVVFAGSGTRPGSGIPMVLISGRLAAERLAESMT